MELNVELDQSNNWNSDTDLYEVVFTDDTNSCSTNAMSNNFHDHKSISSNFDASTSYVTLKSPDNTQALSLSTA